MGDPDVSRRCSCRCATQREHDANMKAQGDLRRALGVTDPDVCLVCLLAEDGPIIHNCHKACDYPWRRPPTTP